MIVVPTTLQSKEEEGQIVKEEQGDDATTTSDSLRKQSPVQRAVYGANTIITKAVKIGGELGSKSKEATEHLADALVNLSHETEPNETGKKHDDDNGDITEHGENSAIPSEKSKNISNRAVNVVRSPFNAGSDFAVKTTEALRNVAKKAIPLKRNDDKHTEKEANGERDTISSGDDDNELNLSKSKEIVPEKLMASTWNQDDQKIGTYVTDFPGNERLELDQPKRKKTTFDADDIIVKGEKLFIKGGEWVKAVPEQTREMVMKMKKPKNSADLGIKTADFNQPARRSVEPLHPIEKVEEQTKKKISTEMQSDMTNQTGASRTTITVGPVVEFLLRDTTIIFLVSFFVCILMWKHSQLIMDNQIPFSVASSWIILAFLLGEKATLRAHSKIIALEGRREYNSSVDEKTDVASSLSTAMLVSQQQTLGHGSPTDTHEETEGRHSHSMFMFAIRKMPNLNVVFPSQSHKQGGRFKKGFSTCLNNTQVPTKWQKSAHEPVSNALMKRLLTKWNFQRKAGGTKTLGAQNGIISGSTVGTKGASTAVPESIKMSNTGHIRLVNTKAESLENEVVDPLCRLRGMDVFLTDCPEEQIWRQPSLREYGLRDRPTFIVNVMVSWGNLVVYFELPEWVKDWDSIEEEEGDSDDTKAFKRFLNGDDKYRNARWKVLPSLVGGPMPIRMIAPSKSEITIEGSRLPLSWHKKKEYRRPDGSVERALLEVDCDLISDKAIRAIASMCRRYVKSITIDLAMIVDKPDDQEEDEPSACLGLWRFDKVDLETCAILPVKSLKDSIKEASVLAATLTSSELIEVAE